MASLNLPSGNIVHGENILSLFATGTPLQTIWTTGWSANWPYLQRAIDYAYGIGCNTVRMTGDMGWLRSGAITQATYDARWAQLIDYCVTLGMYVYPCMQGCTEIDIPSPSLNGTEMATSINTTLATWTGYSNIVGVDLVNECNNYPFSSPDTASAISFANALLVAVHAGGTALSLTISTWENYDPSVGSVPFIGSIVANVDHIDFHMYHLIGPVMADYPTALQLTSGPFTWWNRDIIFGEFGDAALAGATHNTAWTNACTALYGTTVPARGTMVGGIHWNIYDQSALSSGAYGSFDTAWAPRASFVVPLVNSTASSAGPSAPGVPAVPHDGIVVWTPAGSTTDYSTMKLYRNGSLIATQSYGRYDDSANNTDKQVRYSAKVSTGSHGDSAASTELIWPGRLPPKLLRRRVAATFH